MNQTAHVIGNGVSNHLVYIPVHFTVSCNIPTHRVPFDVTTIIDTRVIDVMLEQRVRFTQPIWCTQVVRDYARKKSVEGEFVAMLEPQHRKNSGHHAAVLAWVMITYTYGAWTAYLKKISAVKWM